MSTSENTDLLKEIGFMLGAEPGTDVLGYVKVLGYELGQLTTILGAKPLAMAEAARALIDKWKDGEEDREDLRTQKSELFESNRRLEQEREKLRAEFDHLHKILGVRSSHIGELTRELAEDAGAAQVDTLAKAVSAAREQFRMLRQREDLREKAEAEANKLRNERNEAMDRANLLAARAKRFDRVLQVLDVQEADAVTRATAAMSAHHLLAPAAKDVRRLLGLGEHVQLRAGIADMASALAAALKVDGAEIVGLAGLVGQAVTRIQGIRFQHPIQEGLTDSPEKLRMVFRHARAIIGAADDETLGDAANRVMAELREANDNKEKAIKEKAEYIEMQRKLRISFRVDTNEIDKSARILRQGLGYADDSGHSLVGLASEACSRLRKSAGEEQATTSAVETPWTLRKRIKELETNLEAAIRARPGEVLMVRDHGTLGEEVERCAEETVARNELCEALGLERVYTLREVARTAAVRIKAASNSVAPETLELRREVDVLNARLAACAVAARGELLDMETTAPGWSEAFRKVANLYRESARLRVALQDAENKVTPEVKALQMRLVVCEAAARGELVNCSTPAWSQAFTEVVKLHREVVQLRAMLRACSDAAIGKSLELPEDHEAWSSAYSNVVGLWNTSVRQHRTLDLVMETARGERVAFDPSSIDGLPVDTVAELRRAYENAAKRSTSYTVELLTTHTKIGGALGRSTNLAADVDELIRRLKTSVSMPRMALRLGDHATKLEDDAAALRAKTENVRRILWSAEHERADIEAGKCEEFAKWLRDLATEVYKMEDLPRISVPLQVEGGVAAKELTFQVQPAIDQEAGKALAAEMKRALVIESGSGM